MIIVRVVVGNPFIVMKRVSRCIVVVFNHVELARAKYLDENVMAAVCVGDELNKYKQMA